MDGFLLGGFFLVADLSVAFDEFAFLQRCAGSEEWDEVGRVDRPLTILV